MVLHAQKISNLKSWRMCNDRRTNLWAIFWAINRTIIISKPVSSDCGNSTAPWIFIGEIMAASSVDLAVRKNENGYFKLVPGYLMGN